MLTALRADIRAILGREGGVMTISDLVRAVLTVRGSASPEPVRSANASAATRAAVEAERSLANPSFVMSRLSTGAVVVVVVVDAELADWAAQLGAIADDLARAETIVAPARAICSGG